MKAQFELTPRRWLVKLLSAAALVATPLFASGCIAQAGTGTDDPGASEQALTTAATTTQPKSMQPGVDPGVKLSDKFTRTTVTGGQQEHVEEYSVPADPGGAVKSDGDGTEPDPHPWHTDVTRALH